MSEKISLDSSVSNYEYTGKINCIIYRMYGI